jgi:hypothetical protein
MDARLVCRKRERPPQVAASLILRVPQQPSLYGQAGMKQQAGIILCKRVSPNGNIANEPRR